VKIQLYNITGEALRLIEVNDAVFAQPCNDALVHQVLLAQQANARQGTSSTKTRSEVSGSTKKLYRQKHTGRARAGSIKSGVRRGGGIIFGPHPRSYAQAIPKKMHRQAIRCVLSSKAAENALLVVDEIRLEEPKTREMAKALTALGIKKPVIIALRQGEEAILQSSRNIPDVKTMPARQLNVADMLAYDRIIMSEPALREIETLWGGES
jgi:large subunit ribosomal protein L4